MDKEIQTGMSDIQPNGTQDTGDADTTPTGELHKTAPAKPGAHRAPDVKRDPRQELKDTFQWLILPIIIVLIIRLFILGFYVIPSGSMKNTIQPGDRVIGSMLTARAQHIQRGDIIVFKDPANWLGQENGRGDRLIKRVIGLPGDHIVCEGSGQRITINGYAVDESAYLPRNTMPSDMSFDITVTEGHLFVMGDNRSNSADSRFHQSDGDNGLVPMDDVEAVGFLTYWPITSAGLLDAHHEVFENVPPAVR